MDRAFAKICDSICIAGPHGKHNFQVEMPSKALGISLPQLIEIVKAVFKLKVVTEANWAYLLSLFAQLEPQFSFGKLNGETIRKGDRSELFRWNALTKTSETSMGDADTRMFCISRELINSALLDGRLISLPENSMLLLQFIGSFGRNGVNQAELASFMNSDPKTIYHFLKPLMQNDLIIRTPISVTKIFTYQIILSRFEDDELGGSEASAATGNLSSVEIRELLVDLLEKAPNRCMTSRELFAASGIHRSFIKVFRRAAVQLSERGWIEIQINHQLHGHNLRTFRLIRQGDYQKSGMNLESVRNQGVHLRNIYFF
jgi:hypothetical protein